MSVEAYDLIGNCLVSDPQWGAASRGNIVKIHAREQCAGHHCPFHNPSDHALKDAPVNIRMDKGALVERICEHGVGHDDPDSVAYFHSRREAWAGVHGCDGCCG